jgi:opacity protein-like surface antigen
MFKPPLFSVLFLCVSLSMPVYAAPCYGTKMPDRGEFFSGLEGYYIQRGLKKGQGKVKSLQSFFLISYGLLDCFSIDLKIGSGGIKKYDGAQDNVDYCAGFDGGYGFRVRFLEKDKVKLTGGFQHISVHPFTTKINGKKYKAVLDDWQGSVLASYDLSFMLPYIGARLSRTDYINWIDNNRKRHMSDLGKSVGLILGADFNITEKMWLNIETSFFEAKSLALSLNARF